MTPLRFASARPGLLAQRTSTSKSRAMLGAQCQPSRREAGPARRCSGFAVAGLTNRIQDEQEVPRMSYVLEQ